MASQSQILSAPLLGTNEFYSVITRESLSPLECENLNIIIIRARNCGDASEKVVELSKVTSEHVTCFYRRHLIDLSTHPCVLIECNQNYLLENPVTYQYSRIQVAGDGHTFEGTRQYLCSYCQIPQFFSFFGNDGLIMHWRHSHPEELPKFVVDIMEELKFLQIVPPHFEDKKPLPEEDVFAFRWPELVYRAGADANRLTFSPRPNAPPTMRLSELTEIHLIRWYSRNITDFDDLPHENVKYAEVPTFDRSWPEVAQICRAYYDKDDEEIKGQPEFLCPFCPRPQFFRLLGCWGLMGHLATIHWPVDLPSRKKVCDAFKTSKDAILTKVALL